jgi:methylase of polypeptide subunit release factors
MYSSWRRFDHQYIQPLLRRIRPWRQKVIAGVNVHYMKHLDGGGTSFGQGYVPLLRRWNVPKQARVFEWCAGPGFIGFSLLGNDMCQTLCLADINPEAIEACRRTIWDNRLAGRVSIYHSDNLASIPPSERWDLVVGNPPHFIDAYVGELRSHDPGWRIHRTFFATVGPHLNPSAVMVLQENNRGSTVETFRAMIEDAGLSVVFAHNCATERTDDHSYY